MSFASEVELYHSVTGNCLGLLVRELELACEPGLTAMARLSWAAIEQVCTTVMCCVLYCGGQVGDQSQYVSLMVAAMRGMVPRLRDCLQVGDRNILYCFFLEFCVRNSYNRASKLTMPVPLQTSRKYFTQFCIKFVSSFIPRFIANLYKCKPVGPVGAEQLLLDTHRYELGVPYGRRATVKYCVQPEDGAAGPTQPGGGGSGQAARQEASPGLHQGRHQR